ncbi:hypothetical protein M430DRAFT_258476 [Amorphotheca resinae ATCC 22711]|jgi:hypothetical protein|uniref:Uncharacterized protein n=1 Tax=Amorphotheca resinae ATCC 22711 TaxID=857342 RepID=A0A2T3AYV7_AMORE|nr:hypothetical protein M430DRAFT_258476 [Amorphotheca resinae ATCC 22711]PSS15230.1 hypothetical protein M430DRAFT_258476 [Amorphotheca resinae ATCC 22711]
MRRNEWPTAERLKICRPRIYRVLPTLPYLTYDLRLAVQLDNAPCRCLFAARQKYLQPVGRERDGTPICGEDMIRCTDVTRVMHTHQHLSCYMTSPFLPVHRVVSVAIFIQVGRYLCNASFANNYLKHPNSQIIGSIESIYSHLWNYTREYL